MKHITIISGKGGTGKTMLSASFAALAKNKIMVDCDVDAANLYLMLSPKDQIRHDFRSGHTAVIDPQLCTQCGVCQNACRFEAVTDNFEIDPIACEGCGFCARICPASAIRMEENLSGEWFVSQTPYGSFVHAKLGVAQENSGKLVAQIRDAAKNLAETKNTHYVIIDGPPGIGCPVMASLANIDLAIIVTEPSIAGIHDMKRVLKLTEHFKIPTKIVINKFDLHPPTSEEITTFCENNNIEIIGHIPFSDAVCRSIVQRKPLVATSDNSVTQEIRHIWDRIERICQNDN